MNQVRSASQLQPGNIVYMQNENEYWVVTGRDRRLGFITIDFQTPRGIVSQKMLISQPMTVVESTPVSQPPDPGAAKATAFGFWAVVLGLVGLILVVVVGMAIAAIVTGSSKFGPKNPDQAWGAAVMAGVFAALLLGLAIKCVAKARQY
jgi:hypothetical protein